MRTQYKLFEPAPADMPNEAAVVSGEQKLFRGANGIELSYWEEGGNVIRVALSEDLLVDVTKQSASRMYTNVPGYGRVQKRNKRSLLAALALIAQSLAINSSIENRLKRQRELLYAASQEIHPIRVAFGGRKRNAVSEFSKRDFGPIITSFEDRDEYLLGVPSWLARRSELEWSRKILYGQLRKWFGALESGWTVIKSNGALAEQIGMERKAIGVGFQDLERLRLIHIEGPPKGVRRVYFHQHEWMSNSEAVPTWAKLGQDVKRACANLGRQLGPSWGYVCPNSGHKETSNSDIKNRVPAPLTTISTLKVESELLSAVEKIVGKGEMGANGGLWRTIARENPRALAHAVENIKLRGDNYHLPAIRNSAAFLMKECKRCLSEIRRSDNGAKHGTANRLQLSELVRASLQSPNE